MFSWEFFLNHIFHLSPSYASALLLTIMLAVFGQIFGIIIGGIITAGRLSKSRLLSSVAAIYTWFFRGVPELVLLVLFFSGVAAAGIFRFSDFSLWSLSVSASFQAAIVALALREGAYMGEIIRNGIQSVRKGQIDAARALGMSPLKILRHITVPQAMRVIVPPLVTISM